jgi:poly(A) polymerase
MDESGLTSAILNDPLLVRLSRLARKENQAFYLVGGVLRDLFLGRASRDYDFALPGETGTFVALVEQALGVRFFRVGKEETETVTYRLIKEQLSIDVTFFQGMTLDDDLQRRDFTVNALAYSLRDMTFHRVSSSLDDLRDRVIRTVSCRSLDQDPLRMLRAVRYLCTLEGFRMAPGLAEEIRLKRGLIGRPPPERIRPELDQIFLSRRPGEGVRTLYDTGLLLTLFPELSGLETLGQNGYHHLNVLGHTLLAVEKAEWALAWTASNSPEIAFRPEDLLSLYYALLFHDLGKQDTYSRTENGKVHFFRHQAASSAAAGKIMDRLRFSNHLRARVLRLVDQHMRIVNLSLEAGEGPLKRLVNQMKEDLPALVLHSLADKEASRGILAIDIDATLEGHCRRLLELSRRPEIVHPPALVTGHDVLAMGCRPGPRVGEILRFVRQKQVAGDVKTRAEALCLLRDQVPLLPPSASKEKEDIPGA